MEYHNQPLQFISSYYFHLKTESEEHYDIIVEIFGLMALLKPFLVIASLILSFEYFSPKISTIIQKLLKIRIQHLMLKEFEDNNNDTDNRITEKNKYFYKVNYEVKDIEPEYRNMESKIQERCEIKLIEDIEGAQDGAPRYRLKFKIYKWKVYILSIFVTSAIINLLLFAFHAASNIALLQYANEVEKGYLSNERKSRVLDGDAIMSFFMMIIIGISVIIMLLYNFRRHHDGLICVSLITTSLVVNIIYIFSYYLPYMLLAFIYDPLQATVTYLGLAVYTATCYVFWSNIESMISPKYLMKIYTCQYNLKWKFGAKKFGAKKFRKLIKKILNIAGAFFIVWAIGYFSRVFIYIVTWGSFDDFKVAQHISLPLVLFAFVYFIIKPFFKEVKHFFKVEVDNVAK